MDRLAILFLDTSNAILVLMLVSLGLAIIFGLMNVINMAHGEFLMLGAYAVMTLEGVGLPFVLALGAAPLIVAAIGLLAAAIVIRRTYNRLVDTTLASWGLSLVLRQGMVLAFGPGSHAVAAPELGAVSIGGSLYPVYR